MKRATFLAFLALLAAPAQADGFCEQLNVGLQMGSSMEAFPAQGAAGNCTPSIALGGAVWTHCAWSFTYRAKAATLMFEALLLDVAACLDPEVTTEFDQGVNHPDFYDLRSFHAPAGEVSVSLKDKGGLQQTYVFLHMTPR